MVKMDLSPGPEVIWKYFDTQNQQIREQMAQLGDLYLEANKYINVISRKDIGRLYLHHVLHSLVIAKTDYLKDANHVLDLGTGGGFPGIPLAIFLPHIRFHLIDGTSKKISVVQKIVDALALNNVTTYHSRAEDYVGPADIIISRAVAKTQQILKWGKMIYDKQPSPPRIHRYVLLKGGDPQEEIRVLSGKSDHCFISSFFEETYFQLKFIMYIEQHST